MRPPRNIAFWCLTFSSSCLVALLVTLLVTLCLFVVHIPITVFHGLLPLFSFAVTAVFLAGWDSKTRKFFAIVVLTGLAVLFLNRNRIDFSPDSQTDHLPNILALADGWNPIRDKFFQKADPNGPHYRAQNDIDYGTAAAKLKYVFAALIVKVTAKASYATALNWLFVFLIFACAFGTLETAGLKRSSSIVLALLAVGNPIVWAQINTAYVDILMATLTTVIFVSALGLWKKYQPLFVLNLTIGLLLLPQVKLTGLFFSLAFSSILIGYVFLFSRSHFPKLSYLGLVGGVALVLWAHPYITNIRIFGNIFYPIQYKGNTDFGATKKHFYRRVGRVQGLLTSIFAKSVRHTDEPQFKVPFTVAASELAAFEGPDTRIGGMGPLFGAVFLLSLCLLGIALSSRQHRKLLAFISMAIFGTILALPVTWWMRFTPYLWLFPVLVLFVLLPKRPKAPLVTLGCWALITTMVTNTLLVAGSSAYFQTQLERSLRKQVNTLKTVSKPIRVSLENWHIYRHRLPEWGIAYVRDESCRHDKNRLAFVFSGAAACMPQGFGIQTGRVGW